MTTVEIEPDDTTDVILQSPIRGSGAAAAYSETDTLSAELWQPGATTTLATGLPVAWFTAPDGNGNPTQTGYGQGQTTTKLLLPLVSTLQPSVIYILKVFRVLASDGTRRERIATARIAVRAPAPR
jgi:hypothetical protein